MKLSMGVSTSSPLLMTAIVLCIFPISACSRRGGRSSEDDGTISQITDSIRPCNATQRVLCRNEGTCSLTREGTGKCKCTKEWGGPNCRKKAAARLEAIASWTLSTISSVLVIAMLGVVIYFLVKFRSCQSTKCIPISGQCSGVPGDRPMSAEYKPSSVTLTSASYAECRYSSASVQSPVQGPTDHQNVLGMIQGPTDHQSVLGMAIITTSTVDLSVVGLPAANDGATSTDSHTVDLNENENIPQTTVQQKRETYIE